MHPNPSSFNEKPTVDRGLLKIVTAAINAVPAVKYALGVAGVIASVALVKEFFSSTQATLLVGAAMLVLMLLLLVFSAATKLAPEFLRPPALFFTWAILLLFVSSSCLVVASIFFSRPKPFPDLVRQLRGDALPNGPTGNAGDTIKIKTLVHNFEALRRRLKLLVNTPVGLAVPSPELQRRLVLVNADLMNLRSRNGIEGAGGEQKLLGNLKTLNESLPDFADLPRLLEVECKAYDGALSKRGNKQIVPCPRAQGIRIGFVGFDKEGQQLFSKLLVFAYAISVAIKNEPKFDPKYNPHNAEGGNWAARPADAAWNTMGINQLQIKAGGPLAEAFTYRYAALIGSKTIDFVDGANVDSKDGEISGVGVYVDLKEDFSYLDETEIYERSRAEHSQYVGSRPRRLDADPGQQAKLLSVSGRKGLAFTTSGDVLIDRVQGDLARLTAGGAVNEQELLNTAGDLFVREAFAFDTTWSHSEQLFIVIKNRRILSQLQSFIDTPSKATVLQNAIRCLARIEHDIVHAHFPTAKLNPNIFNNNNKRQFLLLVRSKETIGNDAARDRDNEELFHILHSIMPKVAYDFGKP